MEMKVTDLSQDGLTPIQQQVLSSTNPPSDEVILPSNGMKLVFKKPAGIISLKIAEMLGNNSLNQVLNIYYRMAFSLASIDGMPVRTPSSKMEIEAIIARLGTEDAFAEACEAFTNWIGLTVEDADAAKK